MGQTIGTMEIGIIETISEKIETNNKGQKIEINPKEQNSENHRQESN